MEPITGLVIVGPNEADRYLERTLKSLSFLCDRVEAVLCNATGKEQAMCLKYSVKTRQDNREWGLNQAQIKHDAHKGRNGWMLCLDADEVVDQQITKEFLQSYMDRGPLAYHSFLVNHWDEETKYRLDMCFWRVQFYKATLANGASFERSGFDPGIVPYWAASQASYLPMFVRHYGLMKKEDRERKVKRYEKYDPEQKLLPKDYYDALKSTVWADTFDAYRLRQQLKKETDGIPLRPFKKSMPTLKYHYVKRKSDGVVVDVPDKDLAETLARGFEYVSEIKVQTSNNMIDIPIIDEEEQLFPGTKPDPTPEIDRLQCVLCGFKAQNDAGFKRHKTVKHSIV